MPLPLPAYWRLMETMTRRSGRWLLVGFGVLVAVILGAWAVRPNPLRTAYDSIELGASSATVAPLLPAVDDWTDDHGVPRFQIWEGLVAGDHKHFEASNPKNLVFSQDAVL